MANTNPFFEEQSKHLTNVTKKSTAKVSELEGRIKEIHDAEKAAHTLIGNLKTADAEHLNALHDQTKAAIEQWEKKIA